MNELGILPLPLPITILDIIPTIPIVNLLAKRNNAFGLANIPKEIKIELSSLMHIFLY